MDLSQCFEVHHGTFKNTTAYYSKNQKNVIFSGLRSHSLGDFFAAQKPFLSLKDP